MWEIILLVLGGLGLFLFAINNLSATLSALLGDKAKKWLGYFTKTIFSAILTGTVITTILDSSSAVIIMTVVLVNAGALTFRQSMGIVMGANIGTTFSSQLIALDIGQYSPIPIFLGLMFSLFSKSEQVSSTGKVMLYFGILFFGLYTMERAVGPLKDDPAFLTWMEKLDSPLRGTAVGALVTLVIQSSSATVGMVITLAKKGLLNLGGGIAVMIGAELGTCSDTLLATIRSDRQAVKTGVFHLFFNMISIALGLLIFPLFVGLIEQVSGNASLEQKIANAHMAFNTTGVLLFIPLAPLIENLLNRLLPATGKQRQAAAA
ncbi:Na/Pi cotransporter family protein [Pedobacter yulinensis]|uniref:Na/Pi cotransporter family protein n=1 Tax=Pedobacter yulinensis TaxID=2126353 RepID=A0A2T3HLH2_9SPHI|nr:Na/Pi symporter [Pedobacter yulinensis]PST83269.1 Na/Pi cotransporter family protein [Pedobacter yulinensis]